MIPLLSDLFMFFFFLLTFHIRLVNPIFLMYCILGLDVLLEHHAYCISFPSNTYIYISFFIIFPFLITLLSLKHVVSPIRLRLCITQEVPLPPFIFLIALGTLRTMFSLVGGRVEKGSFVIYAKLFW